MDDKEYSLIEHLRDLRKCLWRAVVGFVVCSSASWIFVDEILAFLRQPMEEAFGTTSKFIVLTPLEYFFTQMKASVVAGIFVSSPWILYQIWHFIAPGLYKKERFYSAVFVISGALFFIGGAIFSYLLVFPPMFKFFIGTLPPGIEGAYSIGMLFGFATSMLLAFGIVFETPVLVFMLVLTGIVEVDTLAKSRRYVIVFAFIIGAILTTPDPLTQVMLAIPLIILYELGLLAARICIKKKVVEQISQES